VIGVTTLNDKIFVIFHNVPHIVVYMSQEPYTKLPNISVNGLKNPYDIAAGMICLFVSDPGSRAIWRVKLPYNIVDQWLSGVRVVTISVSSEMKLVLLVMADSQGSIEELNATYHCEIHVYSPRAEKETVTRLPRDFTSPHHAIMTTRKTFIVCHGYEWHEMNRVCEVDMSGHMVKAFGSAPSVAQLNEPYHVSMDDEERIIVADSRNKNVLLLNNEFVFQHVLVTGNDPQALRDGVGGPFRLHNDRRSGRLLVGLENGHVDIYKFSH